MCDATRINDEMKCGRCGLSWDVADTDPPKCRKKTDRRAIPERRITREAIRRESPLNFKAPGRLFAQIPLELSDPVALELAETYERLRGQGLGGIEAIRATYRLLLDRLP